MSEFLIRTYLDQVVLAAVAIEDDALEKARIHADLAAAISGSFGDRRGPRSVDIEVVAEHWRVELRSLDPDPAPEPIPAPRPVRPTSVAAPVSAGQAVPVPPVQRGNPTVTGVGVEGRRVGTPRPGRRPGA